MRIVLDTNVLVAALLSPNGPPAAVLQLILSGAVVVCFDNRIMSEYREVLRRDKFGFERTLTDELLEFLEKEGEPVSPAPLPLSLPDAADEMFLEVSAAGVADYVITGNLKHFPVRMRRGLVVVSPREFLDVVIAG